MSDPIAPTDDHYLLAYRLIRELYTGTHDDGLPVAMEADSWYLLHHVYAVTEFDPQQTVSAVVQIANALLHALSLSYPGDVIDLLDVATEAALDPCPTPPTERIFP